MKIITTAAIALIIFAGCKPTSNKSEMNMHIPISDVKAENLKGKVQKVETETYLIDSATGQMGKLESKAVETFDDSGYSVSFTNYTTNDSATAMNTMERNARGYVTAFKTTKNGKPLSSMKIESDSMGKYTAATSYDSTGKMDIYYTDIETNDYGQVVSANGHHPDSTLKMSFKTDYDSIYFKGQENKDSVGKVTYSSSVNLNDKKDAEKMEEKNVTKDSTTNTTTTYAYSGADEAGNWTQQTITENGKPKKMVKRMITYKP